MWGRCWRRVGGGCEQGGRGVGEEGGRRVRGGWEM